MASGRELGWVVLLSLALVGLGCSDKGTTEPDNQDTPAKGEGAIDGKAVSKPTPVFDAGGRSVQMTRLPAGTRSQTEAREAAQALFAAVIDREAGDPNNAWGLAHGILARGRGFRATDGRRAIDVLVDDFMKGEPVPGVRGIQPYFPKMEGEVRVEPHTDLILKTLVEAGVPLDEPLTDSKGAPTLERLLRSSRLRLVAQATEGGSALFADPDDAPWSVQAWCQAVDKGAQPSWRTAAGTTHDISTVAGDLLTTIEREYAFLAEARTKGESVKKRRQHIFGYACGGAHLFQGVAACAATGQPNEQGLNDRILRLIDLYLYRIPLETVLVDNGMRQAPGMAPILLNQDVKFLGHALEGLSLTHQRGLWTPSEDEAKTLDRAEERMVFHAHELARMGAYEPERMKRLQRTDGGFQFYLDLVGDAAHAFRGLALRDELKGRKQPG